MTDYLPSPISLEVPPTDPYTSTQALLALQYDAWKKIVEEISFTRNNLNVLLNDQFTKIVDHHMHVDTGNISLAVNSNIDDYSITLQGGHGVVTGNCLNLKENTRFYQGIVTNVATNVITLDTPLDYAFTTSAEGQKCYDNLNANGSAVSPVIAHIKPPAGATWDINRIIIAIYSSSNPSMDNGKFGNITKLTNGIVLRVKNGIYYNIFNIKTNGGFAEHSYDIGYDSAAPAGTAGFRCRSSFNGMDKRGVAIRLAEDDELQLLIRDNLSSLIGLKIVAQGHYVED